MNMKNQLNKLLTTILTALMVISAVDYVYCGYAEAAPSKKKGKEDADKKAQATLKRIKTLRKKRDNYVEQIEFYYFKIGLHNECRSCSANCRKQQATGACRHWVRAQFKGEGRYHRICHQLPQGNRREAGIDQAISSIENKVESIIESVEKINDKIEELKNELPDDLRDDTPDENFTLPTPPERTSSSCDGAMGRRRR